MTLCTDATQTNIAAKINVVTSNVAIRLNCFEIVIVVFVVKGLKLVIVLRSAKKIIPAKFGTLTQTFFFLFSIRTTPTLKLRWQG